jgi:hypothetical protein
MEPLVAAVTVKEACVTDPAGVGCRFEPDGETAVAPFEEPQPEKIEEAAMAAAPCKTWRRVSAKDCKSESMKVLSPCLV